MHGKITRLLPDKGFGFITGDDGQDYFMHRSAVRETPFEQLHPGNTVSFDGVKGPKGLRAESVRVVQA